MSDALLRAMGNLARKLQELKAAQAAAVLKGDTASKATAQSLLGEARTLAQEVRVNTPEGPDHDYLTYVKAAADKAGGVPRATLTRLIDGPKKGNVGLLSHGESQEARGFMAEDRGDLPMREYEYLTESTKPEGGARGIGDLALESDTLKSLLGRKDISEYQRGRMTERLSVLDKLMGESQNLRDGRAQPARPAMFDRDAQIKAISTELAYRQGYRGMTSTGKLKPEKELAANPEFEGMDIPALKARMNQLMEERTNVSRAGRELRGKVVGGEMADDAADAVASAEEASPTLHTLTSHVGAISRNTGNRTAQFTGPVADQFPETQTRTLVEDFVYGPDGEILVQNGQPVKGLRPEYGTRDKTADEFIREALGYQAPGRGLPVTTTFPDTYAPVPRLSERQSGFGGGIAKQQLPGSIEAELADRAAVKAAETKKLEPDVVEVPMVRARTPLMKYTGSGQGAIGLTEAIPAPRGPNGELLALLASLGIGGLAAGAASTGDYAA